MQSFDDGYQTDDSSYIDEDTEITIKGETPCLLATRATRHETLLFLLEREADPNVPFIKTKNNEYGNFSKLETYPLIIAVRRGDLEIARLLLKHGADPNVKYTEECRECDFRSKEEYTALELAIYLKRQDIVALLEEKQAENFYYSEFSETYNDEYIDEDGRYCGTRDRCKTIRHKRDGEKIKEWNHDI